MIILMMPEDASPRGSLAAPAYARYSPASRTAKLVKSPFTTIRLVSDVARSRVVSESEIAGEGNGEWLRKAVVGVANNCYVHGQVVAYDHAGVTVRNSSGAHACSLASV